MSATLELLERELAKIPEGSTIREVKRPPVPEPSEEPAKEPSIWGGFAPKEGSYPCAVKGCDGIARLPGLCPSCCEADSRADAEAEVALARESIPKTFRWARPGSLRLRDRAGPYTPEGPIDPASLASRVAAGVLSGERLLYVFRGPTRSGKTTVACAAVSKIIDDAVAMILQSRKSTPRNGTATLPAVPRLVSMACGIRFVPATDLVSVRERGEDAGSPKFGIAIRASILILDDNGQETSKKDDGASSAARAAATKDVLLSRWNEGRPTILTTYLDDAEIEDLYGGGVFGRIFSDDRSKIVNFMRRQDVDR